jgi:hypothetical protein
MLCRLYPRETLLGRLAQDLQDVAAARREFIQKEHAVVRQRHFAGHRHPPAADQPRIGDRVVGGATRPHKGQVRGAPLYFATRESLQVS